MNIDKFLSLYAPIGNEEMAVQLHDRINKKLAKAKPTYLPGTQIVKYNPATTMFKGNWDRYTTQGARGHLMEEGTCEPLNMPFPKLFEAKELGITINPRTQVIAFAKRNGFMLDATWSVKHDQLIVGTTGTIDSDFVKLGSKYLNEEVIKIIKRYAGYTFIFEVCDPSDPHIFPEPQGLYLIGIRRNVWDSAFNLIPQMISENTLTVADLLSEFMAAGVKYDGCEIGTYEKFEAEANLCDHEGFVVWLKDPTTNRMLPLKLKGAHYKIRKKLARMNPGALVKFLCDRNNDSLFGLHPSYQAMRFHLMDSDELGAFGQLAEQDRLTYLTKLIDNIRKEQV